MFDPDWYAGLHEQIVADVDRTPFAEAPFALREAFATTVGSDATHLIEVPVT